MGTARFQISIPSDTAIPSEAVTNTWYFRAIGDPATALGGDGVTDFTAYWKAKLVAFYTASMKPASSYWSHMVNPTTATLKCYRMDDLVPRVPYATDTAVNLGADDAAGTPCPNEVAVCLSFRKTPASGENPRRRRGRIYLGPFSSRILDDAAGNQARPLAAWRTATAAAASTLKLAGNADSYWSVWSETDGANYKVENGWVDNAFDTQRRRGINPTVRTLF